MKGATEKIKKAPEVLVHIHAKKEPKNIVRYSL
jgi:hypothetical protein